MIHLGDITKITGDSVPVADCIIGGSPCQDLSIAGKRLGLSGAHSSLFLEQIRIVKKMRAHDGQLDGQEVLAVTKCHFNRHTQEGKP